MVGAFSVIKARAPVTGGNFGVWGGMFSTFDCAVKGWRQKEDMWNAIISGFMTGGCLAARSECAFPFYSSRFFHIALDPFRLRTFRKPFLTLIMFDRCRWATRCSYVRRCMRYPAQRLRGCRRSRVEGIQ